MADALEVAAPSGASEDKLKSEQPSTLPPEELMLLLKQWWNQDYAHCSPWHKQAKDDFDFYACRQWTESEKQLLELQKRPPVVFNRTLPLIKAVAGIEINSRHEVAYLPRSGGEMDKRGRMVVKANETLTAASQWMADTSDAEDEESEGFQDTLKCGMGWAECRVGYDNDPQGLYEQPQIDPCEMFWDFRARKKNLSDAQRVWRVKRLQLDEAKSMFPDVDREDLSCSWVLSESRGGPVVDDPTKRHTPESPNAPHEDDPQTEVNILQVQWYEHEKYWLVAHSGTPEKPQEMAADEFTAFRKKVDEVRKKAKEAGVPFDFTYSAAPARKKVYRQAFIGKRILGKITEPQDPESFTFKCITGELDKNKGHWFGLITIIRDPQRLANLALSQTMHILNSTAKGGIIAEKDAFDDQRQAETTYARPDAITWAAPGAISKSKIMQKPGTGIAAGHVNLLEFSISSIRDVSGINLELMGLRDANQPGILEAQRKQAAMTILATLFDSLRRFRKLIGRTRLQFIQLYLARGQLIRITGEEGHQLVPLIKDKVLGEYEVVVTDAPTSPNQKQETWAILRDVLPLFRDMMTPEAAVIVLEHSPLPSKLVDAFKALIQKGPSPEEQAQQQIAQRGAVAEVKKDEASAKASEAKAVLDLANAAATTMETRLAQAQEQVVAALAGPPRRPMLPPDMTVLEAPSVAMPAPPAMPIPGPMPEGPQGPELPMLAPGQPAPANMDDRVI